MNATAHNFPRPFESPLSVLRGLALHPQSETRQEFLDQFRPVRLSQQVWAENLIEASERSAGHLTDLSLASLDKLALCGDSEPLAELLCSIEPAEVASCFGTDPLVWAWINRTVSGREDNAYRHHGLRVDGEISRFDRLRNYLARECQLNVALLDLTARNLYAVTQVVNIQQVMSCYTEAQRILALQRAGALEQLRIPDCRVLPSVVLPIQRLVERCSAGSEMTAEQKDRARRLTALLPVHAPTSFSISDLDALHSDGKNPRILQTLITLCPPHEVRSVLGEEALGLLLWTAVNFSSISSSQHHTDLVARDRDGAYARIAEFLTTAYGISYPDFHQAQATAWRLCNGSVALGLVLKNYELFQLMRGFDYSSIPLLHILETYRCGKHPAHPERYGLIPLEVAYGRVEGSDIHWVEREEAWSWDAQDPKWMKLAVKDMRRHNIPPEEYLQFNRRRFGQTVRCDSPRGLALTFNGYPIAIISFHIDRGNNGGYEFTFSATQGVRVEVWCAKRFITLPTPKTLGPRYSEVLLEGAAPLARYMGLPWVHQGSSHSNWRDKVEPRRFDKRLHDVAVNGMRLVKDERGNWRLPLD